MYDHPAPPPRAAAFLRDAIRASSLTRDEIAFRASLPSFGALVAMERGEATIPYRRIPALAGVLDLDDTALLLAVLAEYEPELHALLTKVTGLPLSPAASALVAWHGIETLSGTTRDVTDEAEMFQALLRDGPSAVLK
jgi:hypothetical protein